MDRTEPIFLVWQRYSGRVDAMAATFGLQARYFGFSFPPAVLRPAEYACKSLLTLAVLARKPSQVWLQLPPTPPLYLTVLCKRLRAATTVVADCHNAMFESPWVRSPWLRVLLARTVDLVLVHNDQMRSEALALGVPSDRVAVLQDRPASPDAAVSNGQPGYRRPWILMPASFHADEPMDVVLEAARRTPDITYVITGDERRGCGPEVAKDAPANVTLTGWLDTAAFKRLLSAADVVLGLTSREKVQLAAAAEAVGFGKAMVLSDTPVSRELFGASAVLVQHTPEALVAGIRAAVDQKPQMEKATITLRAQTIQRWQLQAAAVAQRLG